MFIERLVTIFDFDEARIGFAQPASGAAMSKGPAAFSAAEALAEVQPIHDEFSSNTTGSRSSWSTPELLAAAASGATVFVAAAAMLGRRGGRIQGLPELRRNSRCLRCTARPGEAVYSGLGQARSHLDDSSGLHESRP